MKRWRCTRCSRTVTAKTEPKECESCGGFKFVEVLRG